MGPFDYHVFAHTGGRYQTVAASKSVTNTERAALEQFFFGQTNEPAYLNSLASQPGIIWRRVGQRFLCTRVVQGEKDANGRDTLRFETVLHAPVEAKAFSAALSRCLLSNWERVGDQIAITSLRELPSIPLRQDVIMDVLASVERGERLVHPAKDVSVHDVEQVVRKSLNHDGFSLCYRSLNAQAPVQINFTSTVTSRRSAPRIQEKHVSPASQSVQRVSTASASTLVLIVMLLNTALLAYVALRSPIGSVPDSSIENNLKNRIVSEREAVSGELNGLEQRLSSANQAQATKFERSIDALRTDHTASNDALSEIIVDETGKLEEKIDASSIGTKNVISELSVFVAQLQSDIDELGARPVLKEVQDRAKSAAAQVQSLRSKLGAFSMVKRKEDRDKLRNEIEVIVNQIQNDLDFIIPKSEKPN